MDGRLRPGSRAAAARTPAGCGPGGGPARWRTPRGGWAAARSAASSGCRGASGSVNSAGSGFSSCGTPSRTATSEPRRAWFSTVSDTGCGLPQRGDAAGVALDRERLSPRQRQQIARRHQHQHARPAPTTSHDSRRRGQHRRRPPAPARSAAPDQPAGGDRRAAPRPAAASGRAIAASFSSTQGQGGHSRGTSTERITSPSSSSTAWPSTSASAERITRWRSAGRASSTTSSGTA